jgi:antitoxin ParD1/3/4
MDVTLTPELEQIISDKVSSGDYASPAEVVGEGLRLLKERDELNTIRLEELRRDIELGIQQADAGELVPAEEVFKAIRKRNKRVSKSE